MANQRENQTQAKQGAATTTGRLPESIGMALPDGRMRVFLPRGSQLPCDFSQRFLTRLKEYNKVSIQVYMGDNEFIDDNYYIGEVGLENILLNREGEALLDVAFSVNSNNLLRVSITDAPAERTSNATLRLPTSDKDMHPPGMQASPSARQVSPAQSQDLLEKITKLEEKIQSMEREIKSDSKHHNEPSTGKEEDDDESDES